MKSFTQLHIRKYWLYRTFAATCCLCRGYCSCPGHCVSLCYRISSAKVGVSTAPRQLRSWCLRGVKHLWMVVLKSLAQQWLKLWLNSQQFIVLITAINLLQSSLQWHRHHYFRLFASSRASPYLYKLFSFHVYEDFPCDHKSQRHISEESLDVAVEYCRREWTLHQILILCYHGICRTLFKGCTTTVV